MNQHPVSKKIQDHEVEIATDMEVWLLNNYKPDLGLSCVDNVMWQQRELDAFYAVLSRTVLKGAPLRDVEDIALEHDVIVALFPLWIRSAEAMCMMDVAAMMREDFELYESVCTVGGGGPI